MSELGELIMRARKSKGLRQSDLAAAAGVSRSMVAMIESGAATPTLAKLTKILEVVDLQLSISSKPVVLAP